MKWSLPDPGHILIATGDKERCNAWKICRNYPVSYAFRRKLEEFMSLLTGSDDARRVSRQPLNARVASKPAA